MTLAVVLASGPVPAALIADLEDMPGASAQPVVNLAVYEGRAARFSSGGHLSGGVPDHRGSADDVTAILARSESEGEEATSRLLADTGPFARELGGRLWTIVESGRLGSLANPYFARFKPLGTSPAEQALCLLLESMRYTLEDDGSIAKPAHILTTLARTICGIERGGDFDFLLTDGEHVIAYSPRALFFKWQAIDEIDTLTIVSDFHQGRHSWACIPPGRLSLFNAQGHCEQVAVDCQEQRAADRAILGDGDLDFNCG